MISIPIWLFALLVGCSSLFVIFVTVSIVSYAKMVKIERDYHNRK